MNALTSFGKGTRNYFAVATVFGGIVAVLDGIALVVFGIPGAALWALIAFVTNYIPNIGFIIGLIPVAFLALLTGGVSTMIAIIAVSFFPIILMGVLFGLAMDYEVFLVSQMREDYVHTGHANHAIRTGFIGSARVVTAAAIIMISVFAAFIPDGSATIKPIAIGLAVGVFVDAFLVRMTLVPAVLALLGKKAWWIPRTLDRALPSIDVEGQSLVKHVEQAEWDEANPGVAVRAEQLLLESSEGPVETDLRIPVGRVWTVEHDDPRWRSALVWTVAGWRKPDGGRLGVLGCVLPEESGARPQEGTRRAGAPAATRTSSPSGSTSASVLVAQSSRPWRPAEAVDQALDQSEAWLDPLTETDSRDPDPPGGPSPRRLERHRTAARGPQRGGDTGARAHRRPGRRRRAGHRGDVVVLRCLPRDRRRQPTRRSSSSASGSPWSPAETDEPVESREPEPAVVGTADDRRRRMAYPRTAPLTASPPKALAVKGNAHERGRDRPQAEKMARRRGACGRGTARRAGRRRAVVDHQGPSDEPVGDPGRHRQQRPAGDHRFGQRPEDRRSRAVAGRQPQ